VSEDHPPPDVIGYHGTSLEAVKQAIKTGRFVGADPVHKLSEKGDLFFVPVVGRIPGGWFKRTVNPDNEEDMEFGMAKDYAENTAQIHFVMSELGIPLSNKKAEQYVYEIIFHTENKTGIDLRTIRFPEQNKIRAFLDRYGEERLRDLAEKSLQRKGVLLTIHASVLHRYGLGVGDAGGDARIVPGPRGLDLRYISGIKALDPFAEEFLKRLGGE
jgi:hypothetical protein